MRIKINAKDKKITIKKNKNQIGYKN